MRVVVTEFMDEAALAGFGSDTKVIYDPGLVDDRPATLAALTDADAIIVRNRTKVDQALLDAGPKLKTVGRLGVGLDNIDLAACADRAVSVRPATGANTRSVAEYVIGVASSLVRGSYFSNHAMIEGAWPRAALGKGGELAGRTMGLVGFGGIARAVAERARALGMRIAAFDPHIAPDDPIWHGTEPLELNDLLTQADIISLHVPLTNATQNMIDADAITAMKPSAILINTARGGIVDEAALASALRSSTLGGAALDVFEIEPLTAEAAAIFKDLPNLILTPHIAGVTEEANIRVSTLTVANVKEELGLA